MRPWPGGTPEAAVQRFVATAEAEQWDEAATWIDPVRGAAYAEQRRRSFLDRPHRPTPTEADYRRLYPAASDDVVAWYAARHAEAAARRPDEIVESFAGVPDEAALAALATPALVRAILEAADIRYHTRLVYAAHGVPLRAEELAAHRRSAVRVIGHVADGPDRALVVYRAVGRTEDGSAYEGGAEVVELTRTSRQGWGLPLDHALTGNSGATVLLVDPEQPGDGAPPDDA